MYLKRLDLQGFKSFASRTLFEFGPGITAVVGPNGSGKSNVAEAVRWVLGEQSTRSVRARRLEDLIFSGSSQKSGVGMAEVAITLDNSEGWLPIDYNEVVVSRRAFRSGESEYLINKAKVRLRDVLDLFQRAQVGQNSYAFMGQGLVEEVLVMRPEERRRLLEEAADVRLLRQRLDEARDRLAATRENLERVNLLIEEIGPRLRQLERQASRAVEHSQLARELVDTQREIYTGLWATAQELLTGARAALDQRHKDLTVNSGETKTFEEGLTTLAAAVEEREKEVSTRRQRHRDLSDEVHLLEQRLTLDKERGESQARRRSELASEIESLRNERSDLQNSGSSDQERLLAITPEIEETKNLMVARRQEISLQEQDQAALRRRIAESEERLGGSRARANSASLTLKQLDDDEAEDQGEGSRRTNRRQDLLRQLTDIGRDFETARDHIRDLDRDLENAEQERIGLAAMIESSRSHLRTLENDNLEMESKLGQMRARQELLARLQNSTEGMDPGARLLAGDTGSDDATDRRTAAEGLIGFVRDVVRVPPGLEQAIDAALAENLQALVFSDKTDALAAVELLQKREAGRALVFPLDSIHASPPLSLTREKGIVGVAARLVRFESRFRPLVDALLGRVIVVENLALAHQVLRRGLGAVVTMDGTLLRSNGSVAGGLSNAASESFGRQQELDELPDQIKTLESRHADLLKRLQGEQGALEGSTTVLARLEPEIQNLRDARGGRQSALLENRGRLILLRSEARAFWRELSQGDGQEDRQGLRARLVQDQTRLEKEMHEASESLERDQLAMSTITSHRSDAIDAVSEATAAHADLEGEARSLSRQAEQFRANLERVEANLRNREVLLRGVDAEIADMTERGEADARELLHASQEFSALADEMEPAEEELAHLAGRERSMRDQLGSARSRLLEVERSQLEAEASVTLRTEELSALRESMAGEGFQIERDSVVAAGDVIPPAAEQQGLPPVRGGADVDIEALREQVTKVRGQIRALGPVNEQAQVDYGESKERHDFLTGQVDDLTGSETTLVDAIDELESSIRDRLKTTFAVVDEQFQRYFESFFAGGKANLVLTEPDDMANSGIDISAQPPGKRLSTLAMLSGGERTLTALALLLSLLEAHPSPICVLDEVDAALDESNVGRFVEALRDLGEKTQFIIITHNPRTVEAADSIYGVSMGSDSTSRILSVRLADPVTSN